MRLKNFMVTQKTRISLYLNPELKEALEALAKKKNRSLSNLIETICESEVANTQAADETKKTSQVQTDEISD